MPGVSQTGGTLLDKIVDIIIPPQIVAFLNTTLFRSYFLILNYWSFVLLFSGVLFYFFFPKKFRLWILINIIFEIIEFTLALGGNSLFVEETIDIIWVIIWSLGRFLLVKYIVEKVFKKK